MNRVQPLVLQLLEVNLDDEEVVESDQTEVVEKGGSGGETKGDGR